MKGQKESQNQNIDIHFGLRDLSNSKFNIESIKKLND